MLRVSWREGKILVKAALDPLPEGPVDDSKVFGQCEWYPVLPRSEAHRNPRSSPGGRAFQHAFGMFIVVPGPGINLTPENSKYGGFLPRATAFAWRDSLLVESANDL